MVEASICDVFNVPIAILINFLLHLFSFFFFLLLIVKLFFCHLI